MSKKEHRSFCCALFIDNARYERCKIRRFPNRWLPHHSIVASINRPFGQTGVFNICVNVTCRSRSKCWHSAVRGRHLVYDCSPTSSKNTSCWTQQIYVSPDVWRMMRQQHFRKCYEHFHDDSSLFRRLQSWMDKISYCQHGALQRWIVLHSREFNSKKQHCRAFTIVYNSTVLISCSWTLCVV